MSAAVDVVIVNWNAGSLLRDCVASLAEADRGHALLNVVVIDNGSTDDSTSMLPAGDLSFQVIRNHVNRGFAAACNQGALTGRAPYLLFLNPDTRVSRGVFEHVLAFMESAANRMVGICGVQLVDERGAVSPSCSYHPTAGRLLGALFALDRLVPRLVRPHAMSDWDHSSSQVVEQVIGAFFFTRRSLYEQLQGFDERFFVYYEEVDFTRRAASAGVRTYYLTGAVVYHAGGGTTNTVRAFRQFLVTQSRILYAFKHFSRLLAIVHGIGALTVEPLMRIAYFLARGNSREARASVRAAGLLWRGAGDLIRGVEAAGTRSSVTPARR